MNTQYQMKDRAVLMRLSIGLPGENRQDRDITEKTKSAEHLGTNAGKWIKNLFPPEALAPLKKLDGEARAYHAAVTLPFDAGVGILPAALILEYAERMREFASKRQATLEGHFLGDPWKWVQWAYREHNGSFDPDLYPGCVVFDPNNAAHVALRVDQMLSEEDIRKGGTQYVLEADTFRQAMREKCYFKTEPLPVPDAVHFENTVASLLGTDVDSVNARVQDATKEAQRELLRRMIEPVKAMALKLAEEPKPGKESPIFRDTLVTNLKEIVDLAPKLNITGDAQLDAFVAEMKPLVAVGPQELRENASVRGYAASKAAEVLKKLEGYSF